MVNIGGRSRGCSTCRRRKVKCDEKRPICTRCARWNFECDGGKDIAFIDQGKSLRLKRASYPPPMLTGDKPRATNGINKNTLQVAASTSILLKGFEIQIIICYTKTHLLLEGPIGFALEEIQLSDFDSGNINTNLLHQAILSLSIVFFGIQHKDSTTRDRGYAMYGLAMKELNFALSEPRCYVRDEVFLSVVTLTLLEVFCPTGKDNYVKHMIGLERIIELRGPPSHCSANSFRIYTGVFRMMLYGSLNRRQTSVLARQEWKSFLLSSCPVDEIEEQHLLNSLADCTSLLAEHDEAIKSDSMGDITRGDLVTRKALDLLHQLLAWKQRWDNATLHAQPAFITQFPDSAHVPDFPEQSKHPLPSFLSCSDSFALRMMMLYNGALIYVFRILSSISAQHLRSTPGKELSPAQKFRLLGILQQGTKEEYEEAEYTAALEICRWLPFVLSQKLGFNAASLAAGHLAVRTAWVSLGGDESPEGRWMTHLHNTKSGRPLARGLWTE